MVRCCLFSLLICMLCPRLCKAEGAFFGRLHLALPASAVGFALKGDRASELARPRAAPLSQGLSLRIDALPAAPGPAIEDADCLRFDKRDALSGLRKWSDLLLRISGLAEPTDSDDTSTASTGRRTRAQFEPLLSFSRVGASVYGRF